MANVIDVLNTKTYVVQHNPNCPDRFLVRLGGGGLLDLQPAHKTKDILGYGETLEEAAEQALALRGWWPPKEEVKGEA